MAETTIEHSVYGTTFMRSLQDAATVKGYYQRLSDNHFRQTLERPVNPFPDRLATIQRVYAEFCEAYPELQNLERLSEQQVADLSNQLIYQVAGEFGVEKVRVVKAEYIHTQLTLLKQGGVILKRHGEQDHTPSKAGLSKAALKVEMMQDPANGEDHAKLVSLAEAAGDGLVLAYIMAKSNKIGQPKRTFAIQTARDARSKDLAEVIGLITATTVEPDEDLDCMRLPPSLDKKQWEIVEADKDNPGTLPWEKPKIDAVVGQGIFEKRDSAIHARTTSLLQDPNATTLIVCSSQEHQAISGMTSLRLDPLGVVILPRDLLPGQPVPVMKAGSFTAESVTISQLNDMLTAPQPDLLDRLSKQFPALRRLHHRQ